MTTLEVKQLDVFYNGIQALWNVSLRVESGKIACIIGPNGAGKSTLLRSIVGLIRSKKGAIMVDNERIDHLTADRIVAKGIAYVPEGRHLFPSLTVYENLIMGSYPAHSRKERYKQLESVYSLFPILKERSGQRAGQLSGGEAQMLAIGRALMSKPRILLLDEPSSGLAPKIVRSIFETLRSISDAGITVLLVEQDVFRALGTSEYAYLMENGRVVRTARSEELLKDEEIKRTYLGL